MNLDIYQVDAFSGKVFRGNPAAICPLASWIPDQLMQEIAGENNLSETAFFVENDGRYKLRWFTPEAEVDLCGHATLASGHVLFEHLGYGPEVIYFDTKSGELTVRRGEKGLTMNFPSTPVSEAPLPKALEEGLGTKPLECYKGTDYLLILKNEQQIKELKPDFLTLKRVDTRGIIVSAPGEEVDFVSRFFAPAVGINEDPVTGSAHTVLAPYWANRLGRDELVARQLSGRGGEVRCKVMGDRVELSGLASTYMTGVIQLPD